MPNPEIDLLAVNRGTVTAPAGCGKTQLITDTLKRYRFKKPVLILTHTNSGVAALRTRLQRERVEPSAYRVSTIDGWVMKLIGTFPSRSGHNPTILALQAKTDYAAVRNAAWGLLATGHVLDSLQATYERVFVDEYQDCSLPQHHIVSWIASALPTCVLGDPLQAIFGFSEPTVHWERDVYGFFPPVGQLSTPWRWRNAQAEALGEWLLAIRAPLSARQPIDLQTAPAQVTWVQLDPATAHQQRLSAARTRLAGGEGHVLVIGDSRNPSGQRQIACQTPGAVSVETADLKDLTLFGSAFDPARPDALERLLSFAGELMSNLGLPDYKRRLGSLTAGKARNLASDAEAMGLQFLATPSYELAAKLLSKLSEQPEVRVYRPEIMRTTRQALNLTAQGGVTFHEATLRIRDQNRHLGRPISRRSVGSTLLLKGLEADMAIVLSPDQMDANHLYVALTRGARQLIVCSQTSVLNPA